MNNDQLAQKVLSKLDDLNVEIKEIRSDVSNSKSDVRRLKILHERRICFLEKKAI